MFWQVLIVEYRYFSVGTFLFQQERKRNTTKYESNEILMQSTLCVCFIMMSLRIRKSITIKPRSYEPVKVELSLQMTEGNLVSLHCAHEVEKHFPAYKILKSPGRQKVAICIYLQQRFRHSLPRIFAIRTHD